MRALYPASGNISYALFFSVPSLLLFGISTPLFPYLLALSSVLLSPRWFLRETSFPASFSVQRLAVFGSARRGVPSSGRDSPALFPSGGHTFARAKSHLRGSPREGHASSHRLMSPSSLAFSLFRRREAREGDRLRAARTEDEIRLRRGVGIARRQ